MLMVPHPLVNLRRGWMPRICAHLDTADRVFGLKKKTKLPAEPKAPQESNAEPSPYGASDAPYTAGWRVKFAAGRL